MTNHRDGAHAALTAAVCRMKDEAPDCRAELVCDPDLGPRCFRIERSGEQLLLRGDRPRSLYAAVGYYLHHRSRGREPVLPTERVSPYPNRLIMEDFPFMCYQPTGFDFDLESYAGNLAELGYTVSWGQTLKSNWYLGVKP